MLMSHLNKTSKDILARAMAQEDITVQHSASAQTAAFDVQNRCLILPVWKDMDNAMYDMLVGHEVSHALHTPAQGWQDFVGNSGMRHMFVNVVEDARIERMIKSKFPGLRRDFAAAYASLQERDLFEISGKDVSSLALIDRLNLQFKLGLHCQVPIPFSADEQQYVTRMEETTTFEEVVELARELYEMQKEEDEKNKPEEGEDQQESGQESGGAEGADSSSDDSESGTGSDEGEETEGDGGMQSSGSGDDEDGEESGEGSGSGESGEDSGMSMEDDTDDGESAESTTGESAQSGSDGEEGGLDYDDYSNEPGESAPAGSTQRSFEQGMSDFRDEEAGSWQYTTLPTPVLENIVVDFKTIEGLWTDYAVSDPKRWERSTETRQNHATELRTYLNSIKGTVNQMVQQFQMKMAADADKRTSIAKTGVLDTNTMINYRWSEDIFVKNEVHTDGKSHGMVMYIDWSGSMCNILKDTVEQLLVLVEFCRKVNIPFEVYAFSSNVYCPLDYYSDEYEAWMKQRGKQWNSTGDQDCSPHEFSLYNFLSSRMNKREFTAGLNNFWTLTMGQHSYSSPAPRCLSLGCTPLNEAIWCAMDMVPAFQRANGVQIVNTVFLTDGEGHGMVRGYCYGNDKSFITDKKTKKTFEISRDGGETYALLNMLRDKTGTNLVGVRLHDSKNLRFLRYNMEQEEYSAAEKQYKRENFVTLPSAYDEYFIVKGDLKVETDTLEELTGDASMTKIKNAFIKGGTRKKSSRVIANKMVDIFAA